jgi:hypothetical protein
VKMPCPPSMWAGAKPVKAAVVPPVVVVPEPVVPEVEPHDANARWAMVLGDDLTMQSFDDAGNPRDTTMRIDRDTGRIEILKDPVKPMEIATKAYVDAHGGGGGGGGSASGITFVPGGDIQSSNVQDAIDELDDEKVAKKGDTMSGQLILFGDPTNALGAATKQYVDAHAGSGSVDWGDITGKPSTFPPAPHQHSISDVTGLQAALDAKLSEAPQDGKSYGRRNAGWDHVVSHNADVVDGGNF